MSTESRYRRLLQLLPSWYVERYGEEMVEVHLAGHPEPDARPGVGETLATARLALATRLRAVGRPSRPMLWFVALAAATLLAAHALYGVWVVAWSTMWTTSSWTIGAGGRLTEQAPTLGTSPVLYDVLWLVVVVLLLAGARRGALAVGVPIAILDVGAGLGPLVTHDAGPLPMPMSLVDAQAAILPLLATGALTLAGGSVGAVPRVRERLVAVGVVTGTLAVVVALPLLVIPDDVVVRPWTTQAVLAVALVPAAVVVLLGSRGLAPAWPAAVLTLAVAALLAGPLPDGPGSAPAREADSLVVATVAAAVAVVLATLAWLIASGRSVPAHATEARRREVGFAS